MRRGDDILGLGDYAAAIETVVAILAALAQGRSLRGAHLDVCQAEATARLLPESILAARNVAHSVFPTAASYPAAGSDEWVAVSATTPAQQARLSATLGGEATPAAIAAWTVHRPKHQAAQQLQAAGVPAAPVQDIKELFADPWLNEIGFFFTLADNPITGRTAYEGLPLRFGGWRPRFVRGPRIGELLPDWMQPEVDAPPARSRAKHKEAEIP
jgi:crotonobetainyl-CoA:carnitine CoA-transferase CaiB-like acyl-CoA transferase